MHRHRPRQLLALASTLALFGCPGTPPTAERPLSQPPAGGASPGTITQGQPVGALEGTVTAPSGAIIGNQSTSAGLVHDGGVILFRTLQSIDENAVPGASVTLVDADGQPVAGAPSATTDAQGHFSFSSLPAAGNPLFVQADFKLGDESYSFRSMPEADATGHQSAEVDAASTLVAAKARELLKQGKVAGGGLKLAALAKKVRAALKNDYLPYMAKNSRDLVPALDELLQDAPELKDAVASVSSAMAVPADSWQVSTIFESADLTAKKVLTKGRIFGDGAAVFEVDGAGNAYFATDTSPMQIVRLSADKTASAYATLPADLKGPLRLAFSPSGTLYVVGLDADNNQLVVLSGKDNSFTRRQGTLREARAIVAAGGIGDHIAVDDAGNVYMTVPARQAVLRFKADAAAPEVYAGAWGQKGYAEGTRLEARFTQPAGLALGPDGALYLADTGNNCVRRIAADGTVSTAAGAPGATSVRGGRGAFARFSGPQSVALDAQGNLFVTDADSRQVRRLSPDGSVFLVAGTGNPGHKDGPGYQASFARPGHLGIDAAGNLYVRDFAALGTAEPTEFIRKIARPADTQK